MRLGGLATALAAIALAGALSPAASTGVGEPLEDTRLPHPPIAIGSDAEFELPTSGVVAGDGTAQNPYVIAGWDIIAPQESQAIRIENTSSHVVVRDNRLHEGDPGLPGEECRRRIAIDCSSTAAPEPGDGIVLVGASNVTLEANEINRTGTAVSARDSEVTMRDNEIRGDGYPPTTGPCVDPVERAYDTVLSVRENYWLNGYTALALVAESSELVIEGDEWACTDVASVIRGSQVEIDDLHVQHMEAGFLVQHTRADVRGLTIENATHIGMRLAEGTHAVIDDSRILEARILGALVCGAGTDVRFEDTLFRDGGAPNYGADSLHADSFFACVGEPHLVAENNTFEDVVIGVQVVDATGRISNNTFDGGRSAAIYTQFGDPVIEGNHIEGFREGLLMRGYNDEIVGNTIVDNEIGVKVFGRPGLGPKPELHRNTIADNSRYDVFNTESRIFDSEYEPGTIPLNATRNWWGTPSGPEPGDTFGAVEVQPVLEAPP